MLAPPHAAPCRLLVFALACVTVCAAVPRSAAADPTQTLRATIVQIDGDDVVIDAGQSAIGDAHALTVFRALEVRHPVTRKTLRDRFAIGALSVAQAGRTMSVTRVSGTPAHPFRIGDIVEVEVHGGSPSAQVIAPSSQAHATQAGATQASTTQPNTAQTTAAQATATPTEEQEVVRYWQATLSQTPELRIRYYQHFIQTFPTSRYRPIIETEIAYLGQIVATASATTTNATATQATTTTQPSAPPRPPRAQITLLSPRAADEGQAVEIAAHLRTSESVRSLILHARALEVPGFQSFVMQIDERGHARVTVPATIVRAPGFAYFIQAVDPEGEVVGAYGDASSPSIVTVKGEAPEVVSAEPTTRVRFTSELVSFDGTSGRDYYFVNEGDFLYRVRFHHLYGVRLGYGNYRGQGGTVDELDVQGLDPKPAGFTYGFVETELALHELFGLAFRATVGLGRPDNPEQQRNAITGGFQMRARIGMAEGTHLVLAGEFMPEIGQRGYIGLHWEAIERLPMQAEVVVTDQPVNSDELAVRLIYEVGYRFTDRIAIALRPSYQLRNIHHAGPGVGLAATFDW